MRALLVAAMVLPVGLVARPSQHVVTPYVWAISWVKQALKLGKAKGMDALIAEVQNPKGKFRTATPGTDPLLTVYSSDLSVLAVNREPLNSEGSISKNSDVPPSPDLKQATRIAKQSGPTWMDYQVTEPSGQLKGYRAYVALLNDNLIAAVIPK